MRRLRRRCHGYATPPLQRHWPRHIRTMPRRYAIIVLPPLTAAIAAAACHLLHAIERLATLRQLQQLRHSFVAIPPPQIQILADYAYCCRHYADDATPLMKCR